MSKLGIVFLRWVEEVEDVKQNPEVTQTEERDRG
jgi:hypothetical protein